MTRGILTRKGIGSYPALLASFVMAVAVASCGGDESAITVLTEDEDGTTTTVATAATTATTATAAELTEEPTGTIAVPFTAGPSSGGTEEVMVLKDLRFAENEGYERFVIEFVGQENNPADGLPRYTVSQGTPPYYDAEGNEVPIAGEAWIEIRVNGSTADLSVEPSVEVYEGLDYYEPSFNQAYTIELVPAYENNTLIFVLDVWSSPAYRVIEVFSPPRLVLDIES